MGLSAMSLINKMLQDLDARRSEVTGGDAYGLQIRAVPQRRRMHRAWWVALILGAGLVGVVAWVLMRPAPVAVSARPPLPLKANKEPSVAQPPLPQNTIAHEKNEPVVHADTPMPAANKESADLAPSAGTRSVQTSAAASAPAVKADKPAARRSIAAAPAAKPAQRVSVPDTAREVPAEKPVAAEAAVKPPEPAAPIALNKQIKELTPQQRSDNEYRKATALRQQGKATEALHGLEQALQLDPRHAAARQTLIGLLLENKRHDEALRHAREGLGIDAAQPGLAMIAARLQLEKGELRPAIDTLEKTLPHAAERADYQSFFAALLQRDGRNKEASEHYLLALQKAPQNGVWWMGLGISLQAENRFPEAQESFSRAKASNSLSPELLAFVESKLKQLQR
jgi:MSHA biogenesis protein MshN